MREGYLIPDALEQSPIPLSLEGSRELVLRGLRAASAGRRLNLIPHKLGKWEG